MATTACLLEPFRNAPSPSEVLDCQSKLNSVRSVRRHRKRSSNLVPDAFGNKIIGVVVKKTLAMRYVIRPVEVTDEPFLWDMLYLALYVPPDAKPLPREVIYQPELAKYVKNWGQQDDIGFIAMLKDSQLPVGAAWLRLFKSSNKGFGYVNDETPELTIAVLPDYRGQGIGSQLLTQLVETAQPCYSAVSLSVSPDNPALRLYRRFGFEVMGQGGNSLTLTKNFISPKNYIN